MTLVKLMRNGGVAAWVPGSSWSVEPSSLPGHPVGLASGVGYFSRIDADASIWNLQVSQEANSSGVHIVSEWIQIDRNPNTQMITGGQWGFQMHADGSVYQFLGDGWTTLDTNPGTRAITASRPPLEGLVNDELYKLHGDGSVWRYIWAAPDWHQISDDPTTVSITAALPGVLRLHNDGRLYLYALIGPEASRWLQIDAPSPTRQIAVPSFAAPSRFFTAICKLNRDGSIWSYLGGTTWQQLDDNTDAVAIAVDTDAYPATGTPGDTVYIYKLHGDGSIWMFTGLKPSPDAYSEDVRKPVTTDGSLEFPIGPWEKIDANPSNCNIYAFKPPILE